MPITKRHDKLPSETPGTEVTLAQTDFRENSLAKHYFIAMMEK